MVIEVREKQWNMTIPGNLPCSIRIIKETDDGWLYFSSCGILGFMTSAVDSDADSEQTA